MLLVLVTVSWLVFACHHQVKLTMLSRPPRISQVCYYLCQKFDADSKRWRRIEFWWGANQNLLLRLLLILLDTLTHTHSDAPRQNNVHAMSDPNLHRVVLPLQMVYCPCRRQTLKTREPNSHVEIPDHWISRCDGKQTRDKSPAFLFWWWTTGLVNSLNYAMTTNSNPNIDEWSTDKIKMTWLHVTFQKQQRSCLNSCLYNLYS